MRVAVVQERIDPRRGGAETSTLEMARHLAAQCDVTLVCAATSAAADLAAIAGPVRVHAVVGGGGSRTQQTVRFVAEADRYCRMEAFDVVHAVSPCLSATVYQPRGGTYPETIRRGIASGRSVLGRWVRWFARRTNRRQRFLMLLERALLTGGRPPVVAALSEYVRRQVRDGYGVPDDRIRVIFNGVDVARFSAAEAAAAREARRADLGVGRETPLALFAAHNFALKGLRELIEAAATPVGRRAGFHVVVTGRDRERSYRRRATRLGVGGRLHFVGATADLRPYYAAVDALAHPTWYDPCSRVVLEALCFGLPVVTTRFNGAAEVIEPGRNGFVIGTPADAAALATALAEALHPAVRTSAAAAAESVRDPLSMARHARQLCELYSELGGVRN